MSYLHVLYSGRAVLWVTVSLGFMRNVDMICRVIQLLCFDVSCDVCFALSCHADRVLSCFAVWPVVSPCFCVPYSCHAVFCRIIRWYGVWCRALYRLVLVSGTGTIPCVVSWRVVCFRDVPYVDSFCHVSNILELLHHVMWLFVMCLILYPVSV